MDAASANLQPARKVDPAAVPVPLKVGWASGALGYVTMMILVNVMYLYFMVGTLGVRADVAGALLAGIRLLDMFLDPLMGIASDSTRTRWGARRPWMFSAAFISGLAVFAMFNVPEVGRLLVAYIAAALVLFYIGYTMFVVPFLAMPADMTDSDVERTSLMSYRTVFTGVAGLVASALAPYLVHEFGNDRAGFGDMAVVMAGMVAAAMLYSALSTAKARTGAVAQTHQGLRNLAVLKQRNFLILLLVKLTAIFGITCHGAVGLFFHAYITERGPAGVALLGTVQHIATIVTVPAWRWALMRYSKREALIVSLLVYGFACLSWMASGPAEADWIFNLRAIVLGTGFCGIVLTTTSMLPETIQEDLEQHGISRAGTMAGLFASVEKTSFALSPLVTGLLLSSAGFASFTGPRIAQTDRALEAVRLSSGVLPAAAVFAALAIAVLYRRRQSTIGSG